MSRFTGGWRGHGVESDEGGRWLWFVQLSPFPKCWKQIGCADEELRELERAIMVAPDAPPVVAGTGGVRKIRFVPSSWNRGKRGAVRAYYAYYPQDGLVVLVVAHDKSDQGAIAEGQKRMLRAILMDVNRYMESRRGRGVGL